MVCSQVVALCDIKAGKYWPQKASLANTIHRNFEETVWVEFISLSLPTPKKAEMAAMIENRETHTGSHSNTFISLFNVPRSFYHALPLWKVEFIDFCSPSSHWFLFYPYQNYWGYPNGQKILTNLYECPENNCGCPFEIEDAQASTKAYKLTPMQPPKQFVMLRWLQFCFVLFF